MKRTTAVVALLFGCVAFSDLLAQGVFQWGNNGVGGILSPIYGVDPNNPTEIRRGNTALGIPPGTQTYAGPLLAGTGFTAAIYVGRTASEVMANNAPPQVNGTSSFRTGTAAGRMPTGGFAAVADGIPIGTGVVYYQFRAWNNQNGTVTSWTQVMAAGGAIAGGMDDIHTMSFILSVVGTFPMTDGIRSFQLTQVPEPSLLALGALGLGALLLRRRK